MADFIWAHFSGVMFGVGVLAAGFASKWIVEANKSLAAAKKHYDDALVLHQEAGASKIAATHERIATDRALALADVEVAARSESEKRQ